MTALGAAGLFLLAGAIVLVLVVSRTGDAEEPGRVTSRGRR